MARPFRLPTVSKLEQLMTLSNRIHIEARETTDLPQLLLEVSLDEPRHPQSPFSLPLLVDSFITLGAAGGLAGTMAMPTTSAILLVDSAAGGHACRWVMEERGVDPGAVTVLRNVVAFSDVHAGRLCSARIVFTPAGGGYGAQHLKPLLGRCPLPFEADICFDADDVAIVITLAPDAPDSVRVEIELLLSAWTRLASAGAFEEPDAVPKEPLALPSDGLGWLNDELFLSLSRASFVDTAFDALLNALTKTHYATWRVERVEVN